MPQRRIDITLADKLAAIVDEAIATGDFTEPEQVVAEALALWHMDRSAYRKELEEFRAELLAIENDPRPDMTTEQVRAYLAGRARSDEAA